MIALIKLIIVCTLSLIPATNISSEKVEESAFQTSLRFSRLDSTKIKARLVLVNKCNACHIKRNRRRVFNPENMNPWAEDIYKQVFIKKRMPKGKKIKLTNQEYQQLLTWITSTRNK
jgi:uncharacterized membrane protein